jgi:hypothetical protein
LPAVASASRNLSVPSVVHASHAVWTPNGKALLTHLAKPQLEATLPHGSGASPNRQSSTAPTCGPIYMSSGHGIACDREEPTYYM